MGVGRCEPYSKPEVVLEEIFRSRYQEHYFVPGLHVLQEEIGEALTLIVKKSRVSLQRNVKPRGLHARMIVKKSRVSLQRNVKPRGLHARMIVKKSRVSLQRNVKPRGLHARMIDSWSVPAGYLVGLDET
ncbi:hypothetical protein RRG08_047706 [Elysia crispata]|uniref:Uncharacterized protein n=1 Tax=Elysia crispata TaxID=231223 RepID=A0AAE1AY82_9GAST|nr:hypothetical protein RRG08_047706 [Elysia crispata]